MWLAVHLPWLSLEAWLATLPAAQRARPAVLVAAHRVQAANRAAADGGVRPGLKLATAQALVADLQVGQADAGRDAQALQAVVHGALAFTPSVCTEGHTVLLEVAASLRYFGGLAALQKELCDTLEPLGYPLRLAAAATALGAALLARWRGGPAAADAAGGPRAVSVRALSLPVLQAVLDDAPLRLLAAGREHAEAFEAMGLHRFSDLLRLPRAGLVRRFGAGLLDELDRARGLVPDPRTWLVAPASFDDGLELAFQAEHAEPLLEAAALLLARLVAWARARQTQVLAFALVLVHESRRRGDGTPAATRLRIELAEPSSEARHLQLLLHERLARLPLPASVAALRLHCDEHRPQPLPSGELFPTPSSRRSGWVQLIEQLRARLGDGQVQRLQAVADHRPERATQLRPALDALRPVATAGLPAPAGLSHPVWLLPEPLPLAEREALPLLAGRPLQLLAGPERVESGWWDGDLVTRDYFIAQAHDGALLWVYRKRLPVLASAGAAWFLQGRFG